MATIQDRWHHRSRVTGHVERTALHGTGKRYRIHFRDSSGREVTKASSRRVDAQRWLDEQTVALVRGRFVHPELSRQTVGQWAETWFAGRSHLGPKTVASYRSLLRAGAASVGARPARPGSARRRRRVGGRHARRRPVGQPDPTGRPPPDVDARRRGQGRQAGAQRGRRRRPPAPADHRPPVSEPRGSSRTWPTTADRTGCSSCSSATPGSAGARWPRCASGGSTCSAAASRWPSR